MVNGIRERWAKPIADLPADLPAYQLSTSDPAGLSNGDLERGTVAFIAACADCHGDQGEGDLAGAIANRALGRLISDTLLRRIVITGRPDLKMPDFVKSGIDSSLKRPLTPAEIVDLVAYVRFLQRGSAEQVKQATLLQGTKHE